MLLRIFSLRNVYFIVVTSLLAYLIMRSEQIENVLGSRVRRQKFSLEQIKNAFRHNTDWDVSHRPELVNYVNILTQQPFYWLSKGLQCCAFVSQDGQYVLKFFYQYKLREKSFFDEPMKYLFNKRFRYKMQSASREREDLFSSSKLAFEEFPEEAGIIYVHLNTTSGKLRGIKVYDDQGEPYRVKPDGVSFILQRKAIYVAPTIVNLMETGKVEEAHLRLNQIVDLLLTMAKKGFADNDHALIRNNNIGFVKERAIYIDTGHITKQKNLNVHERMQYEFDVRLKPLEDWLAIAFPELATYWNVRKTETLASLKAQYVSLANESQSAVL